MKASVIIPTYNRPSKVVELLGYLEKQTFKDFEVIVAIDGEPDETLGSIASTKTGLDLKTKVSNSTLGRGKNRNHGVQESTGEILIFLDDDMVIEPVLIQKHIEFHQENQNTILVGAILEHEISKPKEAQLYKSHLSKKWMESKKPGSMGIRDLFITAANLSLPKEIFDRLKGFDEGLNDCEDLDLGIRAISLGIPVHFQPKTIAFHNDPISFGSLAKRQSQYGGSRVKVLAKNKVDPGPRPKLGVLQPIFRLRIWIWILDRFNLFLLFPRSLRYRFYDQIINAHFG